MLRQREFSTLRNKVTMRRVVTCAQGGKTVFPCAAGCGRMRSPLFALIQLRDLVDASQWIFWGPHVPGVWPAPDDPQFVVTRKAVISWLLIIKRTHLKKSTPFCPEKREAVELAEHECDHGGPREEEPAESDFFSDEIVAEEFDDHPVGSFWIYAHPLASKKAAEVLTAIQTIVGQVNSEFQGDVTGKIRFGVVNRLHGDSVWERSVEER